MQFFYYFCSNLTKFGKNMYKRILLKLSGESLMGNKGYGIDEQRLADYAQQIQQIAQMGMLATVINSLALCSALESIGQKARVMTSVRMEPIGDLYTTDKALRLMSKGNVVIIAGGTGNPYFTTDTASVLRAIELKAEVMMKGTRVDGIYSADPEKDSNATKFTHITYDEVLEMKLKVMDLTAITMCRENNMPIYVFDMDTVGNLEKVMKGQQIGTLVKP